MTRSDELLQAAHAIIVMSNDTGVSPEHLEVFYDGTMCDGLCLVEDITNHLEAQSDADT